MTPTETQALRIIRDNKGRAQLSKIAQELKISAGYCHIICDGLTRNKIIKFSGGRYRVIEKPAAVGVEQAFISEKFTQKGFKTAEDIARTSVPKLMQAIEGLKLEKAAKMINEARDKLRKEGRAYVWEG